MGESLVDLVADAVARRPAAARRLVELLHPVVQARVARVLGRNVAATSRGLRQEVDDMSQEVFAFLFEDRAKSLRAWDPARGLSLENFVGLLAERKVISILRSGRQNPLREDPTLSEALDRETAAVPGPEPAAFSRELLEVLLDRLRLALSPLGMHLFELLYVEERTVEEVAAIAHMSNDAVYAWRSRLRKVVSALGAELLTDAAPAIPALPREGRG
jgi:RNA polymerase sigma factor (sigma-70 family)